MIKIENIVFFTVDEIAEKLKITPLTVRRYIKQGRIKAQKVGRPYLISEEALKEFLTPIRYERKTAQTEPGNNG